MSGLELPALIANRLDIMELNPGARQDWAINPSLNSASIKSFIVIISIFGAYQTDNGIFALVPGGDVEEVRLVVVEQQLDDDPGVLAVVLDTDHPHDVGCVL